VPFPIESQLSGAGVWVAPDQRCGTAARSPPDRGRGTLLLNFGAVDWEAVVYVNGTERRASRRLRSVHARHHRSLRAGGEQELVVAVRDPTDEGQQPRGKQVRAPRGIWYTAVTGIWQTVWLESCRRSHVSARDRS
jgi:hypothetical protein